MAIGRAWRCSTDGSKPHNTPRSRASRHTAGRPRTKAAKPSPNTPRCPGSKPVSIRPEDAGGWGARGSTQPPAPACRGSTACLPMLSAKKPAAIGPMLLRAASKGDLHTLRKLGGLTCCWAALGGGGGGRPAMARQGERAGACRSMQGSSVAGPCMLGGWAPALAASDMLRLCFGEIFSCG